MHKTGGLPAAERCIVCDRPLQQRPAVQLERYALVACDECGTWNITPRPDAAGQTAFHDSDDYAEHPYLAHRRGNTAALDRRCALIFQRLGAFVDLASLRGQQVLDVGCDTGQFISSAGRQFGVLPVGVDVARLAVTRAQASGVEAYHSTLEEAPSHLRDFPAMTAIDVIEHVPEPKRFFESLRERLRPGGVAYVETPNVDSTVYRVGRALSGMTGGRPQGTWQRLFPEEHIQYYSREGLDRIARKCGLEVAIVSSRFLPLGEIAVAWPQRLALGTLQAFDAVFQEKLLRWAILRRPAESAMAGASAR